MKEEKKRTVVIGIDGAGPSFIEKMTEEGHMPCLKRLMETGAYSRMFPVMPCDTPTNWSTLMSGAWPGTSGVTSFFAYEPGAPLVKVHPTTTSKASDAEYIWDAASRAGKKCIVVNWPVSWPPTSEDVVYVDGTGPVSDWWRISYSALYVSSYIEPLCRENEKFTIQVNLDIRKAESWTDTPESHAEMLEGELVLAGSQTLSWSEIGWKVGEESIQDNEGKQYHLLIIDSSGNGYDTVYITRSKECSSPVAVLKKGAWSPWLRETFSSSSVLNSSTEIQGDETQGVFKLKLIDLSADAGVITIYRTDIWLVEGLYHPKELLKEMVDEVGPFREGMEIPMSVTRTVHDWDSYFELLEEQIAWYEEAVRWLMHHVPDWDFLAVQIHTQDAINHLIAREITPGCEEYNPDYWDYFIRNYAVTDRMISSIVQECNQDDTVAVVSDHGAIPTFKHCWLHIPLVEAGLMTYKQGVSAGKLEIDLDRSKVVPNRTYIFINVRGRNEGGIVPPEETAQVKRQTIEVLNSIRDPESGASPFELIYDKETAGSLFGKPGPKIGDIVYIMKPGYTDADINYHYPDADTLEADVIGPTVVKAAHHQFLPNAELPPFTNGSFVAAAGPGIKRGYVRSFPIWSCDFAPTLACLMGIEIPRQSEGTCAADIMEQPRFSR